MKKFFTLTLALMATITLWAADVVGLTAGTYDVGSPAGPGSSSKFQKYAGTEGLYLWRAASGHSYSQGTGAGKGIKTQSSQSGLVFYIAASMDVQTIVNFNASKNAADVTATLYSISQSDFLKFVNGTVNSTEVTFTKTKTSEKTITIENAKGNYSETFLDVESGYYFIVCTGTASNTYFNQIVFTETTPATTHALEWDFDGGSCSATEGEDYTAEGQVAEGATITYPANNTMTKDGFAFNGWSTSATTMPASDLTITAQWAAPSAAPTITSQPSTSAVEYLRGETAAALSVEATSSAGSLSYQWYSNTEEATTGENLVEIDGATNASYTPSTTTLGTLYYFCAVTNTETSKAPTTVNSNLSGAITVVTNPVGEHTLTWTVRVENSETTITTTGKNPTSIHLGSMSNIAINGGLTVDNSGKNGGTGKIKPTNGEKVAANYLSMTFTVADGYTFTPTTYTMSTTAVSAEKTVEVEISDTHGHSKSATWSQPKTSSTPDSHNYDLSGSAYEGIVTLKIYVYNDADDNGYRLGSSIVLAGTVAAIDYNINFAAGDGSGEMEPLANKHVGDEVELPACTFTAPDGYAFAAWTSTDVTITDNKFTMPASNVIVTATYAQLFAITCATGLENGSVEASAAAAISGAQITLNNTPASGYKLDAYDVYKTGEIETKVAVTDGKFTMPAYAVTVSATFVKDSGTALDNTSEEVKAVKVLRDGQLFIEKNGHVYNVFGACVK